MPQDAHQKRLVSALLPEYPLLASRAQALPLRPPRAFAEGVCALLDQNLDPKEAARVRRSCSCAFPKGFAGQMRRQYQSAPTLDRFIEIFNAQNRGTTLMLGPDGLHQLYPQCFCARVKRLAPPLPRTWCLCTLGYSERLFSHIFSRPVRAELLCSVMTGASLCDILLHLSPPAQE
jgi:hypothetical protein